MTPTIEEKVALYEELLHKMQMAAEVTMSDECIRRLIANICGWSYAHRQGNGELSDEEQQALIDSRFYKLLDTDGAPC